MARTTVLQAVLLAVILCLLGPGAGQAMAFTWDFISGPPNTAVASPHVYFDLTSTVFITAYANKTTNAIPTGVALGDTWGDGGGFTNDSGTITSISLYEKDQGVNETGLGVAGQSADNEVTNKSFLQLDLQNLFDNGLTNFNMTVASMQPTEGFYLWGSSVLGTPGTLIDFGSNPPDPTTHNFDVPSFGTYRYLGLSANTGDVLLLNGANSAVPEPLTMIGVLLGVGSLSRYVQRRRRTA